MNITLDTIVPALLDALPELRPAHARLTFAGAGPYTVFGDVVYPQLVEWLAEDTVRSRDALGRLFAFFELLVLSADRDVPDVVTEAIVYQLISDNPELMNEARSFMGPAMLGQDRVGVVLRWAA